MPPRQNITDAAWEIHRKELGLLYLEMGISLNAIRAEMNTNYGFCASKSQYETIFKKWGFRKNLSGPEWKFVGHRTKKRKADNKESEVYLNDILIPPKRVKKELDRHSTPSYVQLHIAAPSPKTPQGIAIRTPENPAFFEIRLENLPWFRFQEMFEPYGDFNQDTIARMFDEGEHRVRTPLVDSLISPGTTLSTPSLGFSAQGDLDQLMNRIGDFDQDLVVWTTLIDPPAFLDTTLSTPGLGFSAQGNLDQIMNGISDFDQDLVVWTPPVDSPAFLDTTLSTWLALGFSAQGDPDQLMNEIDDFDQDSVARVFEEGEHRAHTPLIPPAFPDATLSTWPALGFPAQGDPNQLESRVNIARPVISSIFDGLIPSPIKPGSVEYIPTVNSFMQDISLERNPGDFQSSIQKLHGPSNRDALTEFLKFAAYLASNNMLLDDQSDRFLRWVIEANNYSPLRAFFSVKVPTIEAFARCIFESALRIEDAAALRILLKAGVDPGPPTRMGGDTPLQVAVRDCNMELACILLDEGVDVNALLSSGQRTALYCAVKWGDVDMVQMLLDAGADVNALSGSGQRTALYRAVKRANVDMIRMLLDAGADVNSELKCSVLEAACLEEFADVEVVQILLGAGADVETPTYDNFEATALQAAAGSDNVELVRLLLDAGADVNAPANPFRYGDSQPPGTVLQRVAGTEEFELSLELTRLLLGAGADVNARAGVVDGFYGMTALESAVGCGSDELVRMLLDAGAEVNPQSDNGDSCGMTALQLAAKGGNVEIFQMLLNAGADVNAPAGWLVGNNYGITALQAAAWCGSVEITRKLLDAGAEVNVEAGYDGMTALQGAVSSGSPELVQTLLDAGADVNAPASTGPYGFDPLTALERAARAGSVGLVRMLLDAGADANAPGCSPLSSAAQAKPHNIALLRILIAAGANVNAMDSGNQTALEVAIQNGHSILVQVLLEAGADVNAFSPSRGRAVLWAAVERDDVDLVRKLLYAGAKVDAIHNLSATPWIVNALPIAVEKGNIEMVQLLIDAGADVNASAKCLPKVLRWKAEYRTRRTTALLSAARRRNIELVKVLLNAGANLNARPQPKGGWTALQEAACNGDTELVEILLSAGADINAPAYYNRGRTALQAAVIEGHTKLTRRLLEKGADVNAPAAKVRGVTALQGAAIKGQLGIALMLIQAGAEPNAPPAKDEGRTALEGAAEHGRLDMVQLLLNAGVDIDGRDRAIELAEKNGHVIIAKFLKGY